MKKKLISKKAKINKIREQHTQVKDLLMEQLKEKDQEIERLKSLLAAQSDSQVWPNRPSIITARMGPVSERCASADANQENK